MKAAGRSEGLRLVATNGRAAPAQSSAVATEVIAPRNRSSAEHALDHLSLGVLIVEESGAIISRNRRGNDALMKRDGVCEMEGKLRCSFSDDSSELRRRLRSPTIASGQSVLRVRRRRSTQRLELLLVPEEWPTRREQRRFVVFVFDPEANHAPDSEVLRSLYGLSQKEAAVARSVAMGHTLERIAAELQVERETVRSHLKRVFTKTQTSRQSELVRLISLGIASLRRA
jgi:DNA-binding CsgD family transcriptional regulator